MQDYTCKTMFCNGITESAAHDSKHIEKAIDNLPDILTNSYTYNKPCIITGDKGYIINKQRKQLLRKERHVTINTPIKPLQNEVLQA